MKSKFYIAVLIFILPLAVFSQSIREGVRLMEVEKLEAAKNVFAKLYKSSPSAESAFYLGEVYRQQEKEDSAGIYFNEGIRLDVNYPMNYVGLGTITFGKNNAEGKKNFDKAIQLSKSKDSKVYASIAEFYINYDKLEVPQAFSLLDAAVKLDGKNPELYLLRGDAYWKISDGSKAVAEYDKALALNVKSPKTLVRLGNSYKKVMNFDRSVDYYKKALALDSLYAPAYREMGDAQYKNKQFDKAIVSYKKYVEMADHNDETDLRYASFLILNKDFTNALAILKRLEAKKDINPYTYRLLAYAYYEKGEFAKGLQNMEKFWPKVESKKYIAADYEYYGKLLAKTDKDSLAAVNLKIASDMDTTRGDLYAELGNVYLQSKKYNEAAKALERKVKIAGTTQDYFNLGRAYYYDKKYEQADSAFSVLTKTVPTYSHGHLWRAKVNSNLDPSSEKGLAKPHYEKFIELTQNEVEKNKKDLIIAYDYLGYHYLLKNDRVKAKEAYLKMKELDPSNKKAEEGLKILNGK
jgi:tetratricopeptide (TPR) repeat protein